MECNVLDDMERTIPAPDGMTELVRGTDHELVTQLQPLVQRDNVALDLHAIDRIDAAGIAALISLYGEARETGHAFRLCNVRHRVAEILELVGLEQILLSHDADLNAMRGSCFHRPAA